VGLEEFFILLGENHHDDYRKDYVACGNNSLILEK
jgi:hypothetical protein